MTRDTKNALKGGIFGGTAGAAMSIAGCTVSEHPVKLLILLLVLTAVHALTSYE